MSHVHKMNTRGLIDSMAVHFAFLSTQWLHTFCSFSLHCEVQFYYILQQMESAESEMLRNISPLLIGSGCDTWADF